MAGCGANLERELALADTIQQLDSRDRDRRVVKDIEAPHRPFVRLHTLAMLPTTLAARHEKVTREHGLDGNLDSLEKLERSQCLHAVQAKLDEAD